MPIASGRSGIHQGANRSTSGATTSRARTTSKPPPASERNQAGAPSSHTARGSSTTPTRIDGTP